MSATGGFAGTYARQAATYDSARGAGAETLEPLLAELAHLSPGSQVLDIGGGTGNYAVAMAGRGYDVSVLDRSTEMLAVAAGKGLRTVPRR